MVALVVGLGVAAVVQLAPAPVQETLGTGLALAAAAPMTVRYVKRGDQGQAKESYQQMSLGVVDFGRQE